MNEVRSEQASHADMISLERFASGEMTGDDEAHFLGRCELEPERWRAAALACVEHRRLVAVLRERSIPVVWTAHNLTPHEKRPEVYDAIYQLWAETADGVIHHSASGRRAMERRYRFRPDALHAVIPHGHFGDLYARSVAPRAELEHALALELEAAMTSIALGGALDEFGKRVAGYGGDGTSGLAPPHAWRPASRPQLPFRLASFRETKSRWWSTWCA